MTYHSSHSLALLALLTTLIAAPAYAGATYKCQEEESSSSSSGSKSSKGYSSDCDVRYRDLKLIYDGSELEKDIAGCESDCEQLRSIEGARPPEPMKHITTPLKSLVKDYSPYLYYSLYLEELDDTQRLILKRLYRGTEGDSRRAFSLVTTNNLSDKRFAQCVDQIDVQKPRSKEDWAKLTRLQLDNCANQYILRAAVDPAHKENTRKFSFDTPGQPDRKIGLYSHCQPLRMRDAANQTANEYHATKYIIGAWKKLLQDPEHRINSKAELEPRLPKGIKIKNGIQPPNPAPDVRLSMIMSTPYEEIIDPSHPFTPRWDFEYNERDKYSPLTKDYGGDEKNAVYCAGDKEDNIFKVDILTFREEKIEFDKKIKDRIEWNKKCEANDDPVGNPCCFMVFNPMTGEPIACKPKDCKSCMDFKADDPPCATRYDARTDRKSVKMPYFWVPPSIRTDEVITDSSDLYQILGMGMIPMNRKASCDPNEQCGMGMGGGMGGGGGGGMGGMGNMTGGINNAMGGAMSGATGAAGGAISGASGAMGAVGGMMSGYGMSCNSDKVSSMCEKLRAPLIPINKLKMRYHNPDEDESEIPSGAMEGMTFKEYFEDHMPYMRLHDTGRSIQESTDDQQDPDDDKGQYTAIVGVGREGIVGGKKDERCLLGGWGEDSNFLGVTIETPDPVTSWTELKLYQARTARKDGVYCIGRYDKVFKLDSSEEKALTAFGGVVNITRALTGKEGSKRATIGLYPLTWRGYLIDPETEKQFPNFGDTVSGYRKGLDNAKPGDMLILPEDGVESGEKPGLPRVALVLKGSQNAPKNCDKNEDCWVQLAIADNGNDPDICGTTDAAGHLITRYFYKPGYSKSIVEDDYEEINSSADCADQNLQRCIYSEWDNAKIYTPRSDVRSDGKGGKL